ncbi:MAG: hypothetical protein RJB11_2309 [Planctomycetota bacterium]
MIRSKRRDTVGAPLHGPSCLRILISAGFELGDDPIGKLTGQRESKKKDQD